MNYKIQRYGRSDDSKYLASERAALEDKVIEILDSYIINQDKNEILTVNDFINYDNFKKIDKELGGIGVAFNRTAGLIDERFVDNIQSGKVYKMSKDYFLTNSYDAVFEGFTKYLKGMEKGTVLNHEELADIANYDFKNDISYSTKFFMQRQKRKINNILENIGNIFK